jgi:hypothetical protein
MGVSQRGQRVSACVEFGGLDKAPAIAFLPALFADAVDLKGMSSGYKVMFASDLLFEFAHFRREKFHRSTALRTHHVVMTAPVVLVLVARDAIVKSDLAGQPAIGQQFERPVHSGETDMRVFLFDQLV